MDALSDQLKTLPPDVNPYVFLASALQQSAAEAVRGYNKGLQISMFICLILWVASLCFNIYSLCVRLKRGENDFIKTARCRFGTFLLPNVPLTYPVLQIINGCAAQVVLSSFLYSSFAAKPLTWTHVPFGAFLITSLLCIFPQVASQVAGSILLYASRTQTTHSKHVIVSYLWNIFFIGFPITTSALQVVLVALLGASLTKSTSNLSTFAADLVSTSWSEGQPADLSIFASSFNHLAEDKDLVVQYGSNWVVTVLTTLFLLMLLVIPSSIYQLVDLRAQLKHLKHVRTHVMDSATAKSHQQTQQSKKTTLSKKWYGFMLLNHSQDKLLIDSDTSANRLALLESVSKNIALSTIFFALSALPNTVLSVIIIINMKTDNKQQSNARLTAAVLLEMTIFFLCVDTVLLLRTRLSQNLHNTTTIFGTSQRPAISISVNVELDERVEGERKVADTLSCYDDELKVSRADDRDALPVLHSNYKSTNRLHFREQHW